MEKIVKIKQIREYVNHELSEQEHQAFEERMLKDTELAKEVNATIVLKAQLDKKQKQLWKEYEQTYAANPEKWIAEFGEAENPEKEVKPKVIKILNAPNQRKWYLSFMRVAAIFLFFLAAYFIISPPTNTQTVATQYWQQETHPDQFNFHNQIRKGGNTILSQEEKRKLQLEQAYDFFGEKDYQQTLLLLEIIPPESNYYAKALLLKGVTYFQLQQNQQAIQNLQNILQDRSLSGNDDARKFLSLIYLQTNQTEEAKKVLKEIIEAKDSFEVEAKKLLKQLE